MLAHASKKVIIRDEGIIAKRYEFCNSFDKSFLAKDSRLGTMRRDFLRFFMAFLRDCSKKLLFSLVFSRFLAKQSAWCSAVRQEKIFAKLLFSAIKYAFVSL